MRTLTPAPYVELPEGPDPCEGRSEIGRVTLCEPCFSLGPYVALPGGHDPCEECAEMGW